MFEADRGGKWVWIDAVKRRRSSKDGGEVESVTSLKDALVSLTNDVDHGVRMHMATAITSLFFYDGSRSHDNQVTLVSREEQEQVYQQVLVMLQNAYLVQVSGRSVSVQVCYSISLPQASQDQLSTEDDSVNRVGSMITTLLHEACVSPVCERNVASLLVNAVGQIDHDLVAKVTHNLPSNTT